MCDELKLREKARIFMKFRRMKNETELEITQQLILYMEGHLHDHLSANNKNILNHIGSLLDNNVTYCVTP